ncbi:MAG: hypothetical protein MUO36_04300 [Candidatus Hadarchaeum sp.]|nr:hypothetical protein [Candidatus Hadarchaeum sp.]
MKTTTLVLFAALVALLVVVSGCGLVSGTVFISQEVSGSIEAQSSALLVMGSHGRETLDETFAGAKVDLRDNSDWQDIEIDGIEDICVRVTVINLLADSVSGEGWVTIGEDSTYANIDSVRAHGFRIFSGLLVAGNDSVIFTCSETLDLFENLDKLVDAVKEGVFWVWGKGEQNVYHLKYEAIYLGIHVTGSL